MIFGFNWWYIEGGVILFSFLISLLVNTIQDNFEWQPYGLATFFIINISFGIIYLLMKGTGIL